MRDLAATLALALAACSPSSADPTPPTPASDRFEQDMMVRFHMHENFGLAHELERNLIANRLDAARDLARGLAQAPDESGFGAYAKQAARVREHAQAIVASKTVDEAIRHDAKLLAACASCHADSGASPEFRHWPKEPPDRPTVDARMVRHLWAADRLWEGMVGDADESLRAGLDMLSATPLPEGELDATRIPFAKALQRIATDTKKRPLDLVRRTDAYAEILSTCTGCHARSPKRTP